MPDRNGQDELSAADDAVEHAARTQALNDAQHGTAGQAASPPPVDPRRVARGRILAAASLVCGLGQLGLLLAWDSLAGPDREDHRRPADSCRITVTWTGRLPRPPGIVRRATTRP
jgi:hypothetical protein